MTSAIRKARLAISPTFMDSLIELPKTQRSKVNRFLKKFQENPASPGINYEAIRGAPDRNLRSVRIDQTYRGIVLKPQRGNVYMLLWVDHHDDAYAWARRWQFGIHPTTGALQILPTQLLEERTAVADQEQDQPEEPSPNLFMDHRDRELISLGVPPALMPLVRSVKSEDDLDEVEEYLPQEAFEALFLLAAGTSLLEVDRELAEIRSCRAAETIDTEDFEAALERPDSQRRFHLLEDASELEDLLQAPLEKWRIFLHPSQRKLVRMNANGPVRVLGGAGTGKTVVAMHRARHLVEHQFSNSQTERLLFTTFTRNLAADIEEQLQNLCTEEVMKRIEVTNLDRWVAGFLREHGHNYTIAFGKQTDGLWQEALSERPRSLDLDPAFYREEWEETVQAWEIQRFREYARVSRTGRGTPLDRRQRRVIWPVFETYLHLLENRRMREPDGAMTDARRILESMSNDRLPYRSIIVDEAQDLGRQAWLLLRAMVPRGPGDLFIVGDAHQRIYRNPIVLSRCGIEIRGRGRRLRINYRTTEENRRWAVSRLENLRYDDLDGGTTDQSGYRSLIRGRDPAVRVFDTFGEEVAFLVELLNGLDEKDRRRTCLVARTNNELRRYTGGISSQGIEVSQVRRDVPERPHLPGVRAATMHRVKGLEFDRVIIAGAREGRVPLQKALESASGASETRRAEVRERSLLYVAATRARHELIVTTYGTPSPLLGDVI